MPNRVLIGLVKKDYKMKFEQGQADLYYTGPNFPSTIALHNLHFFIPYFKGKGIRDVYEITGIRTIKGSEAKKYEDTEDSINDIRLAFNLKFHRKLADNFIEIETSKMIDYTFIDSDFDQLEKLLQCPTI